MSVKRGHCLCGEVTFEFEGEVNWAGHCHCESCRRNTSSPMTSFLGVPNGKWRYTGETPKVYHSSPGVRRHFCGTCGSPMAFEADKFSHEIHFYAASLENPEDYTPQFHVFYREQLPWFEVKDDLPRHQGMSNGQG